MNIELTQFTDPTHVAAVRQDNDRFRRAETKGALLLSPGIVDLGATAQARIIDAIKAFDDFEDDDPSDTHAIGDLKVPVSSKADTEAKPELIFFRIDPAPTPGSGRVLSIMLASEW